MMVALGALEPHSEKKLRRVLDLRGCFTNLTVPGDRRIFRKFTRSGQKLSDNLIVRPVLHQAVADPIIKGEIAPRILCVFALVSEQCRPLIREIVRVAAARQEPIDQPVALVDTGFRKEFLSLSRCGHTTCEIHRNTTKKGAVVTNLRRRHTDSAKLLENKVVNEVTARR